MVGEVNNVDYYFITVAFVNDRNKQEKRARPFVTARSLGYSVSKMAGVVGFSWYDVDQN